MPNRMGGPWCPPFLSLDAPQGWKRGELAAVANKAAGVNVEGDVTHREAGLIAKARGESAKMPGVGKIRGQPERDADRADAFVAALLHQPKKTVQVDGGAQLESRAHVVFVQALGHLAGARITEAAGAQGDALRVSEFLDAPEIEQVAFGVVEIQRDRAAALLRGNRPVDADHGAAVRVPQRQQLFDQPASQAAHALADQFHANGLQVTQPDLDGWNRQVVERAVLERGFI